jgi:eukaryotic-like serine/threonine-protein kinase
MTDRAAFFLEGILQLDRHPPEERRGIFRQSLASIALAAPDHAPLEGRDPRAVGRSVKAALEGGLFDDLGFLAPPAAGVALYEIAHALPQGPEKRELQRRLFVRMHEGNAATFVMIATRMAAASERGLGVSTIRARVELSVSLPGAVDAPVDRLALTIVSQRALAADWLAARSTGSLPERRLAARLLERAAREASARARAGEEAAIRLFRGVLAAGSPVGERASAVAATTSIHSAFRPLLADRETLVWRHVAAARGLLVGAAPELFAEIAAGLSETLSPTEWRRAATSLVASIAVAPDRALPAALELLRGPLLDRDPGIATAMLWGVPRAADAEPEAAGELLFAIARAAPLFVAETLVDLRGDLGAIRGPAAERCAAALAETLGRVGEEDVLALGHAILADLRSDLGHPSGPGEARAALKLGVDLRVAIERAVEAFVELGTREAHAAALLAAQRAEEAVETLEAIAVDRSGLPAVGRGRAVAAILIRELDTQLLESGVLRSLLALNRLPRDLPRDQASSVVLVDDIEERLARWLLRTTAVPVVPEGAVRNVTLRQRRLRALLHLVDGDTSELEDDPERRARLRDRWSATCSSLFDRLALEGASTLRRALLATVARALDALLRDGAADPCDALLYAAMRATGRGDVGVLAEAIMQPDASRLLRAYARFADEGDAGTEALEALVAEIPSGVSPRLDALKEALDRLARALGEVELATALRPLTDPYLSPLGDIEGALERLAQLTRGAFLRSGGEELEPASAPRPPYPLVIAVGRAVQPDADPWGEITPSLTAVVARARALVPSAIVEPCARVLPELCALPIDRQGERLGASPPPPRRRSDAPSSIDARLPAWMPSRRTLGGFYVIRQLGGGAAGTVFMVTRAEERHDPAAERFALKVPEYDATAARSLSEADFLKLFREEAGALLAVPEHENLARFVTFDAGARPKPLLVMELILGTRCDQLLASRLLTTDRAFAILDGVLAGLSAMHSVGVGHLDIKPSNVILREAGAPVLVDFGLAGRHIRPGCATSAYGAPEVWGIIPAGAVPTALTADVYSFGCFAFEVLTAETLFDAPHEVAMISAHITHDGLPPKLARLGAVSEGKAVASALRRCLRKSAHDRATVAELRAELADLRATMAGAPWPLPT